MKLQPNAGELGVPLAKLAVDWCLLNKKVSTVILGASRPSQIIGNVKALDVLPKLTFEIRMAINDAVGDYSQSWIGNSPCHYEDKTPPQHEGKNMTTDAQIGARLAPLFNLTGKTAVVTGAAQGLGFDTSDLLAGLGAHVVMADLNLEAAKQAAAEVHTKGGSATPMQVDIGSLDSIQALFHEVTANLGEADILINSAADRSKAETFEMTEAQWDRMLDVTLRGTFYCSREAIRGMQAKGQGGAIVNISSVGAVRTTIWGINVHYDAAKAGIDSLTRSFAGEYGAGNIRVNSILPGGMASKGGANISSSYNIRGPIMGPGRVPLGRMGSTMEIAQAVVFLASPASSYITGQIIAVDGGFFVS